MRTLIDLLIDHSISFNLSVSYVDNVVILTIYASSKTVLKLISTYTASILAITIKEHYSIITINLI